MAQVRTLFVVALAMITMISTFGCKSDSSASNPAQPLPIAATWNGSDSAFQESGHWLINSSAQLDATGSSHLVDLRVDFDSQSLIVLAMGERPSAGYWATITSAQQKAGKVYFQAVASRPEGSSGSVMTYPVAAAVIPKVEPRVVIPEIESISGGNPSDYGSLRMDEVARWNAQTGN